MISTYQSLYSLEDSAASVQQVGIIKETTNRQEFLPRQELVATLSSIVVAARAWCHVLCSDVRYGGNKNVFIAFYFYTKLISLILTRNRQQIVFHST